MFVPNSYKFVLETREIKDTTITGSTESANQVSEGLTETEPTHNQGGHMGLT